MFKFLFLCVIIFSLTACNSRQIAMTSATDILAPALAIGGGAIGAYVTNSDDAGVQAGAAAGGALGGYLLGEFVNQGYKEEKAKEFKYGYDLGRANTTKSLYWAYQKLHRIEGEVPEKRRIYNIPAQYPDDGINRVASDIYFPVVEN